MKDFDEKFTRLNNIARNMQKEQLDLKEAKKLYDEGSVLSKELSTYLQELKRDTGEYNVS